MLKRRQSESMVNRTHINSAQSIFLLEITRRQAISSAAKFYHVLTRGFMIQRVIFIFIKCLSANQNQLFYMKVIYNNLSIRLDHRMINRNLKRWIVVFGKMQSHNCNGVSKQIFITHVKIKYLLSFYDQSTAYIYIFKSFIMITLSMYNKKKKEGTFVLIIKSRFSLKFHKINPAQIFHQQIQFVVSLK